MFVIITHFLPRLTNVSKDGSYPLCRVTRVGYSLAYKQKTRMQVTDIDKHSSLLRYGFNYGRKKFYCAGNVLIRRVMFFIGSASAYYTIVLIMLGRFNVHEVASTINIVTIINYAERGVIYDCSVVPIL